jgi:hypothetical protein
MLRNVSIYDPKSGEEAWITTPAFNSLLDMGAITEDGAFAPDDDLRALKLSPWTLVFEATKEQ